MNPHLFGLLCGALVLTAVSIGPIRRWLAERRRLAAWRQNTEDWNAQSERDTPVGPPLTEIEIAGHVAWFQSMARDALILRSGTVSPTEAPARIGGPAWLAVKESWPIDGSGNPLEFIAQLDFALLPPLDGFPRDGLARFFVGRDDLYGADFDHPDRSMAKVLWHVGERADGRLVPPPPLAALECSPFQDDGMRANGVALTAVPVRDLPDCYSWEVDARLADPLRREGTDAVFDRFSELSEARELGHRVGGYPVFTQFDFRKPGEYDEFDTVLLALSSDSAIMWGDVGEAMFLMRAADLAAENFSRVAFYWDCG